MLPEKTESLSESGLLAKGEPAVEEEKKEAFEEHIPDLARIRARVGFRTEAQARWLLNFAAPSLNLRTKPPETRWAQLKWEAWVFAWDSRPQDFRATMSGPEPPQAPSFEEVRAVQTWFSSFLGQLLQGRHGQTGKIPTWNATLLMGSGVVKMGGPQYRDMTWRDAFKVRAYETFRLLKEKRRRVKVCHEPKCQRPFLARGKRIYCSTKCLGARREREYRNRDREKFRAKRRAAYKARKARKLDVDLAQVPIRAYQRRGKQEHNESTESKAAQDA